jgi:hypothetical protein
MTRTFALMLCLASAPAFAEEPAPVASLSTQEGTVLVNTGDAFVTATESQALNAGDRVMVMEGGTATVVFADGCVLALESGSIVDVPASSTCAGSVASVQQIGPSYAQAVGAPTRKDNSDAAWIFGTTGALLAWALIEGDYHIRPTSP